MRSALKAVLAAAAVAGVWVGSAGADVLWYNGDADFVNGVSNEINTFVTHSLIFDDFIVPAGGWTVEGLWSNNQLQFNSDEFTSVALASWEIRSGVSAGDGGTLVAGGVSAATQTATGRTVLGDPEYTIEVSGLNLFLAPGTYWLAVAPHDSGSGRSFISTTGGLNAVGSPAGDNLNSFWTSTFFGAYFDPDIQGSGPYDYSMGVSGTVGGGVPIPEPASLALGALGLVVVALRRRRLR